MKMHASLAQTAAAVLTIAMTALAQTSSTLSCSATLTPSYAAPSVAPGYVARLVATGLKSPRDMIFDSGGALLVVEQNAGIIAFNVTNADSGCPDLSSPKTVINDTTLNHGIELGADNSGNPILFASSSEVVQWWNYSVSAQTNISKPLVFVNNMGGSDHVTRTLKISKKAPGLMIVTRGSISNLDYTAQDIKSGHSQVKAFNITNSTGAYDFNADGELLGWGLRNDVGVDEEPVTGAIYTVENSADQITRYGVDIHNTNPAEELNFLGYLNGTSSPNHGANFGYPNCFTAWNPSIIPNFTSPVGTQFAIDNPNSTVLNDTACSPAAGIAAPRLSFTAHMAPLDILFNPKGTAAWITFHGSWDASPPVGYKLSVVSFRDGAPVEDPSSNSAALDVVTNPDISACPNSCFRPAGLAWDSAGRLWMSSDATGEIYIVLRSDGSKVWDAGSDVAGSLPGSAAANGSSTSSSASGTATSSTAVVPPQGSGSGVVSATATSVAAGRYEKGSTDIVWAGLVMLLAAGFGAFLL